MSTDLVSGRLYGLGRGGSLLRIWARMLLHSVRLVCVNGLELEWWDILGRLREMVGEIGTQYCCYWFIVILRIESGNSHGKWLRG
jgi:hypothetical protein